LTLERTLVLIKPDAVRRGLSGEIISRLEKKGFKMKAVRLMHIDRAMAERHYAEHAGKVFYDPLVEFITSAPLLVRKMTGSTDSAQALPGTIRGDLSLSSRYHLIHASDSPESAQREIGLFFPGEDLLSSRIIFIEPYAVSPRSGIGQASSGNDNEYGKQRAPLRAASPL
jgi:nucleoside-diphosphate kinase